MKKIFTLFIIINAISCSTKMNKTQTINSNEYANFITVINKNNTTKEGIYLNGYIVNLDYSEINKLNGKKINIKGEVTIVKGLDSENTNSGQIYRQGRQKDTKHILNPEIEILK